MIIFRAMVLYTGKGMSIREVYSLEKGDLSTADISANILRKKEFLQMRTSKHFVKNSRFFENL